MSRKRVAHRSTQGGYCISNSKQGSEDLQVESRHGQEIKAWGTNPEQLWQLPRLPGEPAFVIQDECRRCSTHCH